MLPKISRRQALEAMAAAPAVSAAPALLETASRRHDETVERYLKAQIVENGSRWRGGLADEYGLHNPGSAGGLVLAYFAAFLHPGSKYHHNRLMVERARLAADYLERSQNEHGNIDLLTTNFNSPPDTAFVVHGVGAAASLASRRGQRELVAMIEPFLRKAGGALARGGMHTPNHRWVVCAALAQIHEVFPDPAYVRRIDQWLAEGIDIDSDGQFTERSTLVYDPIVDRSLTVVAVKLKRAELLDPVRRNLNSLLYLLHPDDEVVTEISRRQDQYQRGDAGRYWFPLRYLAVRDGNGQFAALADRVAARYASLPDLMEYPELSEAGPALAPLPEDYERQFPAFGVARIRRGPTSATMLLGGSSRFFTFRRGGAVVQAVRFASAFFGKAQFVPSRAEKRGRSYRFEQSLDAGYYQPLDPPRKIGPADWAAARSARRRTEVCRLEQSATVTERDSGFQVRLEAGGTAGVPLAVEINFREGGELRGCVPVPRVSSAYLLASGQGGAWRVGAHEIRFGPGLAEHRYTQVRGAEPKLPGTSVYLTGYTPFDHTVEFTWDKIPKEA